MELTKLEFAVNTKQLEAAVALLGEVQEGTAALGKEEQKRSGGRKKLTDEEKAANEESKKAAAAAKKAAAEQKKLGEEGQATANKLEKLKDQLKFLRGELVQGETGFTKMQAGVMSAALAAGASTDVLKEYAETFDNFNRITGQNPFDKSVGGLKFLDSELNRLQKTTELATEGFKLTQNQIKLLAQDTEALTQVNRARGASEEDINRIVSEHKKVFGERAVQLNEQIERSKELEKQTKSEANTRIKAQEDARTYSNAYWKQEFKNLTEGKLGYKEAMGSMADYYRQLEKDSKKTSGSTTVKVNRELATSTKWLANEEAKMISVLNTLNMSQNESNSLNEKAARSISNYERNLRQAGITGAEAAKKLELYREQQTQIQSIEQRNQGKFLSRALQPQIGDVAVSLAAGQNPLTVMLQQGDQIRGLIAQSGIEGAALQKIMRDAFSSTLTSIKDTAVAMSSVVGGAFVSMGKSLTGWIGGAVTAITTYNQATKGLEEGTISALRASRMIEVANARLMQSVVALVGMLSGALVIGLGALGVAAYQASKQEDELSKSLALSGGSMGLNRDSAIAYAEALNSTGVSTSKAIDAMTAMAKEGGFLSSEINLVTTTAVKMQKDAGVAIEETIKHFAKLKEKPVEALMELAKSSGLISTTSLEAVIALEKQGDKAAAVALAMKISADTQIEQSNRIKTELSSLGRVMKWFGEAWTGMWDAIKGTQYTSTVSEQLKGDLVKVQEEIESVRSNLDLLSKLGIKGDPKLLEQLKATEYGLAQQLKSISQKAAAESEAQANNVKDVEILKDRQRLIDDYNKRQSSIDKEKYTRQQAINAAIAQEAKLRKAAGGTLSAEEVSTISSTVGQEYDKSKAKGVERDANKAERERAQALEIYNDLLGKSSGYTADYNNKFDALQLSLQKGDITQRQYYDAFSALQKIQPVYIQQEKEIADATKKRADNQEWLNNLIGKSEGLGKTYATDAERLIQMLGEGLDPKDFKAGVDALNAATPAAKELAAVQAEVAKTTDSITLARKAVAETYAGDFIVDSQKKELESLQKLRKEETEADIEYNKNVASIKAGKETEEYTQSVNKYREMAEAKKQLAKDVYDRERYLQSDLYQMYSAGFDALKGLAKDFGAAVTDEFMNFATTGKSSFEALTSSFGSMIQKMIYDLIRLRIQKQVTGLFDALITMGVNAMMGGSSYGYSGTGTNPMSLTGSSITAAMKTQANGGAWNNGVQMYAKGGVFDGPTMFQHSGGLGVLGEKGSEAVMPLKRDSSGSLGVVAQVQGGGGSATQVVINNYSSEKAEATESIDSRGNRSIEVTIGDMVSSQLSKSGSSSQKAMRGTFGMQPQLIRR